MELLTKIQKELKAPKNQLNKFGGYNYRSCEDIVEAVKPFLPYSAHLTLSDEIVLIGDRYYVKATATLRHNNTEASASAFAREEDTKKGMDGAQITGSASSYARKYALNGLLLIDDTKDADTQDNRAEKKPEPTKVPKVPETVTKAREAQREHIKTLLAEKGCTPKTLGEAQDAVKELTGLEFIPENYDAIITKLTQ